MCTGQGSLQTHWLILHESSSLKRTIRRVDPWATMTTMATMLDEKKDRSIVTGRARMHASSSVRAALRRSSEWILGCNNCKLVHCRVNLSGPLAGYFDFRVQHMCIIVHRVYSLKVFASSFDFMMSWMPDFKLIHGSLSIASRGVDQDHLFPMLATSTLEIRQKVLGATWLHFSSDFATAYDGFCIYIYYIYIIYIYIVILLLPPMIAS